MIQQPITTLDELREIFAPPSDRVLAKEIHELDELCRAFIARSPFVLIGSTDGDARVDISPKGDPPGFVQVLDAHTLVIPERLGNHRADTYLNVLHHPPSASSSSSPARTTPSASAAPHRSPATSTCDTGSPSTGASRNWCSW